MILRSDMSLNRPSVKASGPPPSTLLDGLIHYWPLDEASGNRADAVGSYTMIDNGTGVGSAAGKNSLAAQFADDAAYLGDQNEPGVLAPRADYAVSLWFKATSFATGSGYTWFVSIYYSQGTLIQLGSYGGDFDTVQCNGEGYYSQTKFSTGQWYNVVANYADAGFGDTYYQKFYVNGSPIAEVGSKLRNGAGTANYGMFIGRGFIPYIYNNCIGLVDEVAIWNRKLTTDEITELYNGGTGKFYPFS